MERIEGVNCADSPPYGVRGWLKDAGAERQRSVVERSLDVLVHVHAIDPGSLPGPYLERGVPPGLRPQLAEYGDFLDWVAEGRSLIEFRDVYRWLTASVPVSAAPAFCWGDSRLGNMLFRDDRPVAVLDWEMAGLAPPEADLAWWLVFDRIHTTGRGMERLPGVPPDSEQVAMYEMWSGHTVTNLHWYEVWAALRVAVLLFRFHDMLVANDMAPADPQHAAYWPAVRVLRDLLEGTPA